MPTVAPTQDSGLESFAALFEESLARHDMRSGEVISAEVVRIDHNFVVVNAGLKSESFIPIDEFKNDVGELEVNVGDYVPSLSNRSRTVTATQSFHVTKPNGLLPGWLLKKPWNRVKSLPGPSTEKSRAA